MTARVDTQPFEIDLTDGQEAEGGIAVDSRSAQWANRRVAPDRGTKRAAKWVLRRYHRATAPIRVRPDYLIIGSQRCGTTSLQMYLRSHPLVASPRFVTGTHFFDRAYPEGLRWYQSHFPTVPGQALRKVRHGAPTVAGESSSYYVFHPLALDRIAATLPGARLILMLRDPVDRAYSQYQHEMARGFENLPFREALEREAERLDGEAERMKADPTYDSVSLRHHSYFSRGLYADQLQKIFSFFPEEQVLVLESGGFYARPDAAFRRVQAFLGLPEFELPVYARHYAYSYSDLDQRLRTSLAERFAEPNQRLFEYLGTAFDWTRP